jgi:cell division septation protein DedD
MTSGYQIAQTAHSVAEYSFKRRILFNRWRKKSGWLISLAVKNLEELNTLMNTLRENNVDFVEFFEPDVNEITGICITPSSKADALTKKLSLAGKKSGAFNKHKKE